MSWKQIAGYFLLFSWLILKAETQRMSTPKALAILILMAVISSALIGATIWMLFHGYGGLVNR